MINCGCYNITDDYSKVQKMDDLNEVENIINKYDLEQYVALDTRNNLMWLKSIKHFPSWDESFNYCNELNNKDYMGMKLTGWRLPTKDEYMNLLGNCEEQIANEWFYCDDCFDSQDCKEIFENIPENECYWTGMSSNTNNGTQDIWFVVPRTNGLSALIVSEKISSNTQPYTKCARTNDDN